MGKNMISVREVPYYWWDSAISPEICDAIIAEGKKLNIDVAGVKDDKTINKKVRTTEIAFFPYDHFIEGICKHFIDLANKGGKWNFELDSHELVQFGEYRKGCFYKLHRDCDVDSFSNRKLSISVQLSDGDRYSGGDLRLKNFDAGDCEMPKGLRNQGSVIVFPSMLMHEVTKVRSGIRYSLVQWHSGPDFK
jgi:PKHD-type hydroxylase